MTPTVTEFRDLQVYGAAFDVALDVFELSKPWPNEERYALTDQIRRSSRSVCANIAEARMKRRYPKHFASKLSDAGAEAAATLVWIDFAHAHGYVDPEATEALTSKLRAITGGLVKMMARPDQWCVREEPAGYDAGLEALLESSSPRLPDS